MGAILAILTGITSVAAQGNVAIPTIFTLIQTVRDIWAKHNPGQPVPSDSDLVQIMRQEFTDNHNENLAEQADLLGQIADLEDGLDSPLG